MKKKIFYAAMSAVLLVSCEEKQRLLVKAVKKKILFQTIRL